MGARLEDQICRSRKILQNPYAYLDAEGGYDALPSDKTLNVHEARRVLQNQYAYLDEDGEYSGYPYGNDSTTPNVPLINPFHINPQKKEKQFYSRKAIESIARKLQRELWLTRKDLFPARREIGAIDVLDPTLALESLGYSVQIEESLGQYSANRELFEVAGIINNSSEQVQISRRFSPVIRNFTTAHELGHAVLHQGSGLHRDRALDGSPNSRAKDNNETEADIFAAYFLLPAKLVKSAFQKVFLTQTFVLEEDTAFALMSESVESLQNRCRTLRDLTRILASAERYNGVQVTSLANQFKVSAEAMAIRLEELDLVHK